MKQELRKKNTYKYNNKEYLNFSSNANQWWHKNGSFAILHRINPLRIKYIIDKISANIKIKKKSLKKLKVLDIGCGGGLVCEPLAKFGFNVTGIDFVPENIIIAKKHAARNNLKIKYKLENLNNLNIKNKYDVILLLEVIEHLDNWKKTLKNINKIIKPKGIIILSTINRNMLSRFLALFLAENFLNWIPKGTHNYNKLVKPKELMGVLIKNKYKIIDLTGMAYNPLSDNWNLSKNTRINYFCAAKKS